MKYLKYIKRLLWRYVNILFFAQLGKGTYFQKGILITPKYIYCGKQIRVGKNCRIEGIAQYNNVMFRPQIFIEDNVSIQQNLHLTCASKIEIGKNTAIGANVTITDIHHPYLDVNIPIEKQDIENKDVKIGEDCKIYNNSVILPGTIVGKHCTIGANSVVSGVIPDYSVVVGAPAKIVKQYNFLSKMWEKIN